MRKFLAIFTGALPAHWRRLQPALRLPLYLDDGILCAMIRDYSANGVPLLRFWGGSPSFQYYRPMVFSLLELNYALEGHLNAFMRTCLICCCLCWRYCGQRIARASPAALPPD
ncbi:MAG: hypothetical protein U0694_07540 [Anaerolineae bacterium]